MRFSPRVQCWKCKNWCDIVGKEEKIISDNYYCCTRCYNNWSHLLDKFRRTKNEKQG